MLKHFLIILILSASCSMPSKETQETKQDTTRVTGEVPVVNKLTDRQQSEGWKSLFDGTTLSGWKIYRNLENDSWEVHDQTLHCKAKSKDANNKRSDLITIDQYENFEFTFDWKIAPKSNSGIMFHVTEEFEQPYATGPEYQLIDNEGYPEKLRDVQLTGANYDMHVANVTTLNAPGEWNSGKIIVQQNHVEHWLNGTMVVSYELGTAEWKAKLKQSKWKDYPSYGLAQKGHLDLQDHGDEVWFRNLFIKPL